MKFESRSYRGNQVSLPTPEVFFNPDEKLLVVATGWGKTSGAKKAVQTLTEYFLSTHNDREATSPFRRIEYLSSNANNLRIATLLANEILYREENRNEYRSGVELFACSLQDRELTWVQIGHPHVIFSRPGHPIMPMGMHLSLAAEVAPGSETLPPLPNNMLGLTLEPGFTIQTLCPQKSDSLILLSQAWVDTAIFDLKDRTFSEISHRLAGDGEDPFWLGLLQF